MFQHFDGSATRSGVGKRHEKNAATLAALFTIGFLLQPIHAYGRYSSNFPNGNSVPLKSGGYCDAIGHPNCNGRQDYRKNVFGVDFNNLATNEMWSAALCRKDSDGDGLTNGDELGDPCCIWSKGATPLRTNPFLSAPDDSTFKASTASCLLAGAPSIAPTASSATMYSNGVGLVIVPASGICVCKVNVEMTYSGKSLGTWAFDGSAAGSQTINVPFSSSSFDGSSSTFSVKITTTNLATGTSPVTTYSLPSPVTGGTLAPGVTTAAGSTSASSVAGSTSAGASPLLTITNSSASALPSSAFTQPVANSTIGTGVSDGTPVRLDITVLFPLVLIICASVVGAILHRTQGLGFTTFFLHTRLFPHLRGVKGLWLLDEICEVTVGEAVIWVLYAGMCAAVWIKGLDKYAGEFGATPRAWGDVTLVHLVFILLPVARSSIWQILFGLSFERAIRIHRWLGRLMLVWCGLHGFGLLVCYNDGGEDGGAIITAWGPDTELSPTYNNLAGLLCFVFWGLLTVTSISWVRRKSWELFMASHMIAFPLSYVFAFLHYNECAKYMAFGVILYAIDLMARVVRIFGGKCKVINTATIGSDIVKLEVQFDHSQACCGCMSLRGIEPGQWINLCIPKLSSFEFHPFSVTTIMSTEDATVFTLYIKSSGSSTYTGRLFDLISHQHRLPQPQFVPALTVFAEGPYGEPGVKIANEKCVLLFAGGIGVTPMVNILVSLANMKLRDPALAVTRVRLIWSLRSPDLFLELERVLSSAMLETFSVDVYLTGTRAQGGSVEMVELGIIRDSPSRSFQPPGPVPIAATRPGQKNPPGKTQVIQPTGKVRAATTAATIRMHAGRPDIGSIISAEASLAEQADSRLNVLVCGPPPLISDVHNESMRHFPTVLLHTEVFEF